MPHSKEEEEVQKNPLNSFVQVVQPQTPGLVMQLATAGVAACIADMITFPLDTTKVIIIFSYRYMVIWSYHDIFIAK